jgi:2-iminoacetate synthase
VQGDGETEQKLLTPAEDLARRRAERLSAASSPSARAAVGSQVPASQFEISDGRTLDQVVSDLMRDGYVPSWCTACYRLGRTGEKFMKIAKRGDIHNYCHPNALLTLNEFKIDYASPATKAAADKLIAEETERIPAEHRRKSLAKKMAKLNDGARDLYF